MDKELQLHICPDCSREFKSASALTGHSRVHKSVVLDPDQPDQLDEILAEINRTKVKAETFSSPSLTSGPLPHITPETVQDSFDNYDFDDFRFEPEAEVAPMNSRAMANQFQPKLLIRTLPHYGNLPPPKRATSGSAGYDLHAAISQPIWIGVGQREPIPSGICIQLPPTMYALCAPRSGLATKNGITLANAPGIIDSDYRGEIICHLVNLSSTRFCVEPGMRIAQMIINSYNALEVEVVDTLDETVRGTGGFGSTGL